MPRAERSPHVQRSAFGGSRCTSQPPVPSRTAGYFRPMDATDIAWNNEARSKILEDSDRVLRDAVLDLVQTMPSRAPAAPAPAPPDSPPSEDEPTIEVNDG